MNLTAKHKMTKVTEAMVRDRQRQIWGLMGDVSRDLRVRVVREITGEKIPVAKCGLHATIELIKQSEKLA